VFVALFGLAAAHATGCVQLNASHCANLQGNATCAERGGGSCSRCTSTNDGCVGTVPAGCEADVDATESGTTTEAVTATGTTSGMSMSSTSAGPTSSEDGSTADLPRMDMPAICGDGMVNTEFESCDDTDLNGLSCESLDFDGGELGCNDDCTYDLDMCMGEIPCGNDEIDKGEECDGENFNGETCETVLDDRRYEGQLLCFPGKCTFLTSQCCLSEGSACDLLAPDPNCCEGTTCTLDVLNKLSNCKAPMG
jgi:hypothetical protein